MSAPHTRTSQLPPRPANSQVGGQLARCRHPALADTGALANPLIRGIETAGEFVIRDNSFRQIRTAPGDLGPQCHRPRVSKAADSGAGCASLRRARSTRILSRKPFTFRSIATPIALAKPKASAEPWLLTAIAFKPRKIEPL